MSIERLAKVYSNIRTKIDSNIFVILLISFNAFVLFFNILFYNSYLSFMLFVFDLFVFTFFDIEKILYFFFSIISFTFAFKSKLFSTSFVSLILLYFYFRVIISMIRRKKIPNQKVIVGLLIFVIYVFYALVFSFVNIKISNIRLLPSYFLYLFLPLSLLILDLNLKYEKLCLWMLFGVLLSSLVALPFFYIFKNGEQKLTLLTGAKSFAGGDDFGTIKRFSSLNPDPNYGAIMTIIPISILLCVQLTKREKTIFITLSVLTLGIFSLSLSKMYFVCLFIIFLEFIAKIYLKKKSLIFLLSVMFSFLSFSLIFLNTSFGSYLLTRFISSDSSSFIRHLTSNRSSLFSKYGAYILSNPLKLIFGNGPVSTDYSTFFSETHNVFLGLLYQDGVLGTVLIIIYYVFSLNNLVLHNKPFEKQSIFIPILFFSIFLVLNMQTSVFTPIIFCCLNDMKKVNKEEETYDQKFVQISI